MKEKLLTIRETSQYLGVPEKEVIDLAHQGKIPAYKIGGVYLRFKKEQLADLKKTSPLFKRDIHSDDVYSNAERIKDFLYFHDFYILALVIIAILIFFIFSK